jgi:hypothetical protein
VKAFIGIDQSKKSTALHALDLDGETINYTLITPPIELDSENLICYQWDAIKEFIEDIQCSHEVVGIVLEGAAFAAMGASNDLLWGIQWYVRTRILVEFDMVVGIITAASWRSSILTRVELQWFKAHHGGKIGLKHAAVSKLPPELRNELERYVYQERNRINLTKGKKADSRSEVYKDALFDLTDSWGLAWHRICLHHKGHRAVPIAVKKVKRRKKATPVFVEAPVIKKPLVRRSECNSQ